MKKRISVIAVILTLLLTACGQSDDMNTGGNAVLSGSNATAVPAATPTADPAVTSTATPAPDMTPAPTETATAAPSPSAATTAAPSPSAAPTVTPSPTAATTATPSPTAAPSPSAVSTAAPSPSAVPTAAPSPAAVPTATPSPSAVPTAAPSPTAAPTAAPSPSAVPTVAPSPAAPTATPAAESSFLGTHGALSVNGTDLVDQNGEKIQLYGVSTHGLAWFPQYVNEDGFRTLHEDWKINCVRLALYTDEYGGYANDGDKENLKNLIRNGIAYATNQDMYVIVDWHVLNDRDPDVHKADALAFFEEIASEYADYTNIIYEICNEPNGYATWESVKNYANEVIPVIRAHDEDAVILVGSPTWSQDIDKAAADPLDFDNVMYTLHFYADTHRDDLRSRLETCVSNGLPVFISEFGTCDASGNGANNFDQTSKWLELAEKYNISFFSWSLCNKAETSALISSSCSKTADWTENELSEAGKWLRNYFRGKE